MNVKECRLQVWHRRSRLHTFDHFQVTVVAALGYLLLRLVTKNGNICEGRDEQSSFLNHKTRQNPGLGDLRPALAYASPFSRGHHPCILIMSHQINKKRKVWGYLCLGGCCSVVCGSSC